MGAGYDISASRAESLAQGANVAAGTVFNFGNNAKVDGGTTTQTADPTATASAARNLQGDTGGNSGSGLQLNWWVIGGVAVAIIALVAIVELNKHKK